MKRIKFKCGRSRVCANFSTLTKSTECVIWLRIPQLLNTTFASWRKHYKTKH